MYKIVTLLPPLTVAAGGYVICPVCVSQQDYCKSNHPISLKLVTIGPTTGKNWLNFGGGMIPDMDSASYPSALQNMVF